MESSETTTIISPQPNSATEVGTYVAGVAGCSPLFLGSGVSARRGGGPQLQDPAGLLLLLLLLLLLILQLILLLLLRLLRLESLAIGWKALDSTARRRIPVAIAMICARVNVATHRVFSEAPALQRNVSASWNRTSIAHCAAV